VDPSRREVWEYNIAIAEEAAAARLRRDPVRLRALPGQARRRLRRAEHRGEPHRGHQRLRRRRARALVPYNVFLGVDLFGYAAWNQNDTDIGQTLASLVPHVDYISLMLYPSGFQFGIPGYRNPSPPLTRPSTSR